MSADREAFLQRVRQAVAAGNRAGARAEAPPRGNVGYQGGGSNPVERFANELAAAGGRLYLVADRAGALGQLLNLVREHGARRVLVGGGPVLGRLDMGGALQGAGLEVLRAEELQAAGREALFAIDLGVSGVDYLIAETGSLVLLSRPEAPRSLSLLPPVHVAIAERAQLLPDLFDLLAVEGGVQASDLPSALSIITGPSKTGDIEMRLVTGVHGPGHLHVILIEAPSQSQG
jgi:L-lactate dehydrogenase complex protein LldG